jgi:hypothetical protein
MASDRLFLAPLPFAFFSTAARWYDEQRRRLIDVIPFDCVAGAEGTGFTGPIHRVQLDTTAILDLPEAGLQSVRPT